MRKVGGVLYKELMSVVSPSLLVDLQTSIQGDFEDDVQQVTDVGIV